MSTLSRALGFATNDSLNEIYHQEHVVKCGNESTLVVIYRLALDNGIIGYKIDLDASTLLQAAALDFAVDYIDSH